jgi:hypothetical protein
MNNAQSSTLQGNGSNNWDQHYNDRLFFLGTMFPFADMRLDVGLKPTILQNEEVTNGPGYIRTGRYGNSMATTL